MDLSERQLRILQAIINDYIATAEPIGSRTIAKKYAIGVSSATIRNEMSDLEDMGLINQPHTSSGRVPSEKGYRYYVDSMMEKRPLSSEEAIYLQQMIMDNISRMDYMMQETAKALAMLTKYPAIISEPYIKNTKIKHIQLVPLDDSALLLVLITDNKTVKNQIVNIKRAPSYDTLTKLSKVMNKFLCGLTIREIDRNVINNLLMEFGTDAHVVMPVLGIIAEVIEDEDDVKVFTSGVKNILTFPEFAEKSKAEALFQALEDKDFLITLLGRVPFEGIQIAIGGENPFELLRQCSLVKTNFTIDNNSTGCIALIGPTRMDYAQAVSVLSGILMNMRNVINALGLTGDT